MLILKLIEQVPFFDQFSKEEKIFLVEQGSFFQNYKKDETIILEDSEDSNLFIIVKGIAQVTKSSHPENTIAVLTQGAIFGELSFLTKRPRSTNVKAMEPTICFVMNGSSLEQMSQTLQLAFKDQLIGILIKRLDAMNNSLLNLVR